MQLKKPKEQLSKQSPGYITMEQKMKPLSKMITGMKTLKTKGIAYLRLVLKLYLQTLAESCLQKIGSNCKKEAIGAYVQLRMVTKFKSTKEQHQQARFVCRVSTLGQNICIYLSSLFYTLIVQALCRYEHKSIKARSCQITRMDRLRAFIMQVGLGWYYIQSTTFSTINEERQYLTVRLRSWTLLFLPKLILNFIYFNPNKNYLIQRSSIKPSNYSIDIDYLQSYAFRQKTSIYTFSCINYQNYVNPSNWVKLLITQTTSTKCSLISRSRGSQVFDSSMLSPYSQRARLSLPKSWELKQLRTFFIQLNYPCVENFTDAIEAMIKQVISISWYLFTMLFELIN